MTARVPTRLPLIGLVLLAGVAGCGTQAAPLHPLESKPEPPPVLGTQFDATCAGSIRGRVTWIGAVPESHSFRDAGVAPAWTAANYDSRNPLLPRVDPANKGVAGAVVFLRAVDPARSRPWDLPPARVVMSDASIGIEQGAQTTHVAGIVRHGDEIEMVSTTTQPELLRARGSAYFALAFPDPDRPLRRTFDRAGLVELSSAAGNFWARGWLFIVDHPYYARTDKDGGFVLDRVPDGSYELVCWMPSWHVERFEKDPETAKVARLWFAKPLEKSMAVKVERGQITEVRYDIGLDDFPAPRRP